MKTQMMITVDEELKELLKKEDNMSGLINDLLHNHFHETPNFRKLRIINRAKEVNRQQVLLKQEEDSINEEMKLFLEDRKQPKELKEEEVKEPESQQQIRKRIISEKNSQYLEDVKHGVIKKTISEPTEDEAQ